MRDVEALLDDLKSDFTIACPAFPETGRTIYFGHLFVGDRLLSDSSMRHHPLTPMTDPDLVRVLGRQTKGKVGLIPFATVNTGPEAIIEAMDRLRREGYRHAIVDAVTNRHLMDIGEAAANLALITGGSGLALGLPANFVRATVLRSAPRPPACPPLTERPLSFPAAAQRQHSGKCKR